MVGTDGTEESGGRSVAVAASIVNDVAVEAFLYDSNRGCVTRDESGAALQREAKDADINTFVQSTEDTGQRGHDILRDLPPYHLGCRKRLLQRVSEAQ